MNPSDTEIPALRRVRVRLVAVLLGTRPSLQNLLRSARPSLVRLLHRYYVQGLAADSDSSVPFMPSFGATPSWTGLLKAAKMEVSGL